MKNFFQSKINNLFSGHKRSVTIKKNILASFFLSGSNIVIGFLMIPLCLDYLDTTRYGIWLTVSSILVWFSFFEIGLGSGLRNKLAEALAVKDFEKGRIYVSTTYVILSSFALLLLILYFTLSRFIDWTKVFNTDQSLFGELSVLVNIVFAIFFIKFVLNLIVTILYADQKPALANSIGTIGNLLAIIMIYFLTKTTEGSLVFLGIALSFSPLLVLIIFSLVLFSGKYRVISPSFQFFRYKNARSLFNIGLKFFIIQISGLILYQSTNIIISQTFGPSEVTPYNIAFKLFSTINMIFSIIVVPYWSAYTEAWEHKDITWIKRSIKKLLKIWCFMAIMGIITLIFSKSIYQIWLGDRVHVNFVLSAMLLIYFLLFTFGGIFNMFINGVGKIKLQLYSAVFSAIIFYPLTYVLIKYYGMGIEGIAFAIVLTNLFSPIIAFIQAKKIINSTARGIWNE